MKTYQSVFRQGSQRGILTLSGTILGALLLTVVGLPTAKAQLVTYFDFNEQTSGTPTTATLTSDAPGQQTTTITNNFTTGASVFGGTTLNLATGDTTGASGAYSPVGGTGATTSGTGGNNGLEFTFGNVSLTGIANDLTLSYATQRTSTGFTTQTLLYSVDGGAFTQFAQTSAISLSTVGFGTQTFTLPAADFTGGSSLAIEFVLTGATAASGNNRIDNIQLNVASPVPEPSTIFGGALVLGVAFWSQRGRLRGLLSGSLAACRKA